MKKIFINQLIGMEYIGWEGKKVIIKARTGAGKTTFVLKSIVPYVYEKYANSLYTKKKVLILSNRNLLKQQYESALFDNYNKDDDFFNIDDMCDVKTYQQLSREIIHMKDVSCLLADYEVIVCDEAHYFYADSDFSMDAYKMLYTILYAGYLQNVIFMSATIDEVTPLIYDVWKKVCKTYREQSYDSDVMAMRVERQKQEDGILIYDHLLDDDYSRFQCGVVDSMDDLCDFFVDSTGKSIFFIDNKSQAEEFKGKLIQNGLNRSEVGLIHSNNIDSSTNDELIKKMIKERKLEVKVLITTSVLDNGVSIEDPDIKNVCIVTNSKLSLIQMLGRVRDNGDNAKINLIFVKRDASELSTQLSNLEQRKGIIENNIECYQNAAYKCNQDRLDFILAAWSKQDSIEGELYRSIFIPCINVPSYFRYCEADGYIRRYGNTCFVLDQAAVKKIKDTWFTVKKLYEAALKDPLDLIKMQMGWLNLADAPLKHIHVKTDMEKKAPMIKELMKIQNFNNDEFSQIKKELVDRYFRNLYPNIKFRGGKEVGCSTDKFKVILNDVGLKLKEDADRDGRKTYSVIEISEVEVDAYEL